MVIEPLRRLSLFDQRFSKLSRRHSTAESTPMRSCILLWISRSCENAVYLPASACT